MSKQHRMSGHRHELDFIRSLASLMGEYELHKVEYNAGDTAVKLERSGFPRSFSPPGEKNMEQAAFAEGLPEKTLVKAKALEPISPTTPLREPAVILPPSPPEELVQSKGQAVKSPMVGTVYLAPAPNAAPYVAVGDTVVQGQILCIIEAMKIMNPFKSPVSGKVQAIAVQDAQAVEYDEVLLWIA